MRLPIATAISCALLLSGCSGGGGSATLAAPPAPAPAPAPAPTPATPPAVSQILPNAGPVDGGNQVVLAGSGFTTGTAVTFGGVAATVIVSSATATTLIPPAHPAGGVDVVVTNPNGQSVTLPGAYTFVPPAPVPVVMSSIVPAAGSSLGGTTVTLAGSGFGSGALVTFGTTPATILSLSSTALTVTTPVHAAGAVDVVIALPDGRTATSAGGFTFTAPPPPAPAPALLSMSPHSGSAGGGLTTTLTGANFAPGATVTIGLLPAVVLGVTPTAIKAIVPMHAPGAVDVAVSNPDGQQSSLPGLFTYTAPTAPGTPAADSRPAPGSLGGSGNNRWQIGSPTGLYIADPAAGELAVQGATAGSIPLVLVNLDKGKPPADTVVTLNGVQLIRWPGNPDFMWTLDPAGPQPLVGTGGFVELVATSGGGRQRQLILKVPEDVAMTGAPAPGTSLSGATSIAITFTASLVLNLPGIPGMAGIYPTATLLGYDPVTRAIPNGAHGQALIGAGQLGVALAITSPADTTQYLLDLRWPGLWQPDGETGAFCGLVKRWVYAK